MTSETIYSEHVDVLLLGNKVEKFVKLLYPDRQGTFNTPKANTNYINFLKPLYNNSIDMRTQRIEMKGVLKLGNMTKLTKSIITKNLWLTINFHYPNQQFYDPFVSDFIRGSCRIAISVHERDLHPSTNSTHGSHQQLVHNPRQLQRILQSTTQQTVKYDNKQIAGNSKSELFYESKILSAIHHPQLAHFGSVLTLTFDEDDSRLVESASNIKTSINQVCRWIAERHFELQHRIKLNKVIGDQIEQDIINKEHVCRLI